MRRLSEKEIKKFASMSGAKKIAVENFLGSLPLDIGEMGNKFNLANDAASYGWNGQTVWAIECGIDAAFK